MDTVLRGLSWQCCMVYLCDIIIYTKGTFERHIVELAAVLERLANAGLSLKPEKCSFAKQRLEYLGHELTKSGIRPLQKLVNSVRNFPAPLNTDQVRRFVHLAGYYRRFSKGFGVKMSPLTRLLRKATPWRWESEEVNAFDNIKMELTKRPLLVYPDFSKPFTLETDACAIGLGSVLMQDLGKGLQPVAYASKVNSVAESKYSITDLECFAVIWAIKLFRPYLFGRHFTLITDHIALTWLMTKKNQLVAFIRYKNLILRSSTEKEKQTSWLMGFRAPTPERAGIYLISAEGQLPHREIKEQQRQSPMVKKLLSAGFHNNRTIFKEADGLVYIDGVETRNNKQIVLPSSLWPNWAFKGTSHARASGKELLVAKDEGYYTELGHVLSRLCNEIVPPLRPLKVGSPGDRWALDIAGPLPRTPRGNRYVITAVDYATRYAVAKAVSNHTAMDVATFLMEHIILVLGPCRELVMDGAPELNGNLISTLVELLEAEQVTPVPYRPALLGLVERWNRTWKDMVSIYCATTQDDWDKWLPSAVYAHNGSKHSTTKFSPNGLMMGRQLRSPKELLLRHRHMATARQLADLVIAQEQARQAKYYNKRNVRKFEHLKPGMLVWLYKPPRGAGATKLVHRWVGPAKILEDAGFDNFRLLRLDTRAEVIAHCSFLVSYFYPTHLLGDVAEQIMEELADEERASLTCGINQTKTQDDVQHVSSSNNSVPARTRKYVSAANATANERWKPPQNVTHRRRGRKRPASSERKSSQIRNASHPSKRIINNQQRWCDKEQNG
ncbi:Retrovirus-related Pol Polyprotein [Phytophthora palmivora]|uniref:Retrovirus-related Pol Polyprotein n=1 Tax=Phytophthora palmivora TaxID=4796 RepID=A0A2P4X8A8_9STRA|nr:Retrovirus-related Pol Polyprotein [Phytophthora palmivora]